MMLLVHEFILIHTLVEIACVVMNQPVLIIGCLYKHQLAPLNLLSVFSSDVH
jgi:hypothetical protein